MFFKFVFVSIMVMCKECGIEKFLNEFLFVIVFDECDYLLLVCFWVCIINI